MQKPTTSMRLEMRNYISNSSCIMKQNWRDLLFLHWSFEPEEIQKTLPQGLYVDTFENKAYVGLTPFFLKQLRLPILEAIQYPFDMMEVNLRTYVYNDQGIPGIWFYSLNIDSFPATIAARGLFQLPYYYSNMQSQRESTGVIDYSFQRIGEDYVSEFKYKPQNEIYEAQVETLEFFLVERYAFFIYTKPDIISMGRVKHLPYPISKCEVLKWDNYLFQLDKLPRPKEAPNHILYSPGVDVEIFPLEILSIS